jgi:hypothetical protein
VLEVRHGLAIQHPMVEQALTQFFLAPLLLVVAVVDSLMPMAFLVDQVVVLVLALLEQEREVLHLRLVKETLVEIQYQIVHFQFFQVVAVALVRLAIQVPLLLLERGERVQHRLLLELQ